VGVVVALTSGASAQTAASRASEPVPAPHPLRAGTELVALQVSVVDGHRRFVSGLQAEDFSVYEEGAPQPITLFSSATAPIDLMLLLDTSSSMAERMPVAREAAINFVRSLRSGDRASVVLFSSSVRIAEPLTADKAALEAAILRASAGGGTALHEALYVSLRELARLRSGSEALRRQALIVLTDGDDTSSALPFAEVLAEARRNVVTVFTIIPSLAPNAAFIPLPQHSSVVFDLRALAENTGGRAFAPLRLEDLSGVYSEIADELGHQYWLAYVPAASSDGFRRISVRVASRPDVRARTRSGYYAKATRPGRGAERTPSSQ
jgi:VWFA-related protein